MKEGEGSSQGTFMRGPGKRTMEGKIEYRGVGRTEESNEGKMGATVIEK